MIKSKTSILLAVVTVFTLFCFSPLRAATVFINEIHYDNAGGDVNEGVEIAGAAGTDLAGWLLEFYNGGNGEVYGSLGLGGIIPDQGGGYGVLAFAFSGIQNGAPDGVGLADAANDLVQFLSYEGVFDATDGAAAGTTSQLIGVAESSATLATESLQLMGTGAVYGDFAWQIATSSFGLPNDGQVFDDTITAVPLPAGWMLYLSGLAILGWRRSCRSYSPTG